MALARLTMLKSTAFLNIGVATYDDILKQLIESATGMANDFTHRTLNKTTYTAQKYTGDGSRYLTLEEWPISSISAITIYDGSAHTAESTNYVEQNGDRMLYYPKLGQEGNASYGGWPKYEGGIRITYVAGYDDTSWATAAVPLGVGQTFSVPANLEYAVAKIAAYLWIEGRGSTDGRLGVSQIVVGAQDVTVVMRAMNDPDIQEILTSYRRPTW